MKTFKTYLKEATKNVTLHEPISDDTFTENDFTDFKNTDTIINIADRGDVTLIDDSESINYIFGVVGGSFNCDRIGLKSLKGAPKRVDNTFDCSFNKLTSLEGSPEYVNETFFCHDNQLTTLKGISKEIGYGIECSNNKIASLEHCPPELVVLNINYNKISSLVGIHKILKKCQIIGLNENPIEEGGIGLIFVENLQKVVAHTGDFAKAVIIISKYLRQGKEGLLDCANELEEAGLEAFAKL